MGIIPEDPGISPILVIETKFNKIRRPAGPESSCSPGKKDPERYPESC